MLFKLATIALLASSLTAAAAPSDRADASYYHANALYDQEDDDFERLAIEEYQHYLDRWPSGRFADDARYRIGKLYERLDEPRRAVIWYLKVRYLNPGSLRYHTALADAERLLERERELRNRRARYERALAFQAGGLEERERHRILVDALVDLDERDAADGIVAELRRYQERYPGAPGNDRLQFAQGILWYDAEAYKRAVAAYQGVRFLYPESELAPQARLRAADLIWKKLDRPYDAERLYEKLAREQPEREEAATALFHMGEIEQRELKRYVIALRNYDEVAERYPDHVHALDALMARADIYREQYGDLPRTLDTYALIAERYTDDPRAAAALERAGKLYEDKLGNIAQAVEQYLAIGRRYPQLRDAAERFYEAAELVEKKLRDERRAAGLYAELMERFPGSRWAEKARRKLAQLGG